MSKIEVLIVSCNVHGESVPSFPHSQIVTTITFKPDSHHSQGTFVTLILPSEAA